MRELASASLSGCRKPGAPPEVLSGRQGTCVAMGTTAVLPDVPGPSGRPPRGCRQLAASPTAVCATVRPSGEAFTGTGCAWSSCPAGARPGCLRHIYGRAAPLTFGVRQMGLSAKGVVPGSQSLVFLPWAGRTVCGLRPSHQTATLIPRPSACRDHPPPPTGAASGVSLACFPSCD